MLKKIHLFCLLSLLASPFAFSAQIDIIAVNMPPSVGGILAVQSLTTGKVINAQMHADLGIISDKRLANQGESFLVLFTDTEHITMGYCVDQDKQRFVLRINSASSTPEVVEMDFDDPNRTTTCTRLVKESTFVKSNARYTHSE